MSIIVLIVRLVDCQGWTMIVFLRVMMCKGEEGLQKFLGNEIFSHFQKVVHELF